MQSFNDIWNLALEELTKNYPKSSVDLWFSRLTLCDLTDSRAVLICDEVFKYKILKSKYMQSITEAIANVIGFDVEVIIVDKTVNPEEYAAYVPVSGDAPEPVNLADFPYKSDNSEISKSETSEAENSTKEPSFYTTSSTPNTNTSYASASYTNELSNNSDAASEVYSSHENSKAQSPLSYQGEYTFENFIVGNSNKFAHAASVAVANEPACKLNKESYAYNPLFIYGPSGLGKTHLLYAIINHIRKTRSDLKIIYVKGEEFTNQLIDSISKKTPEQFREKYRTADVLLIDDIQFIAGRDSTQEEFFHTFNALYEDHKQIILTSDRPPRDIKTLEDRLKTRFEWGITADIQPPDADLRAAILKKKAAAMNIRLSNEVVNFLAENLKSNIRQVEGAIKKLGALSLLTGSPITIELAKNSIADLMTGGEPVSVTIDRILEKTAKKYGVSVDDIKGTKRTKEIAFARHVSIYIIRKMTDMSLPQIGKLFKRDHTTILSSLKTIEKELGSNSMADIEINELMKEIKA
jgi:chromosomal replication initiator protein